MWNLSEQSHSVRKSLCSEHEQNSFNKCKADGLVFHCGMCFLNQSFTVDAFKLEERNMSGTSVSVHWLKNDRRIGYFNHFSNVSSCIFWS